MATTIPSGFTKMKSNLEITGLQKSTVSTRQQEVRKAVANGMTVLSSFLTGSYARSTMISPLKSADVDMFVILDPSYYSQNGQASLLDRLRGVLLKTYTRTPKISRNGQAVTITFTDFVVDVVPAFNRRGGGYLIPDSKKGVWIATDPKDHEAYTSQQNVSHNGDFIPLVKMLKGWNRNNGDFLNSFYLELLAAKALNGVTISDYSSGVRYFFDKAREMVKYTVKDPSSYGGQVNGINSGTVDAAVSKVTKAYNIALSAESNAGYGYIKAATDEWRIIFGSYFPAYG